MGHRRDEFRGREGHLLFLLSKIEGPGSISPDRAWCQYLWGVCCDLRRNHSGFGACQAWSSGRPWPPLSIRYGFTMEGRTAAGSNPLRSLPRACGDRGQRTCRKTRSSLPGLHRCRPGSDKARYQGEPLTCRSTTGSTRRARRLRVSLGV